MKKRVKNYTQMSYEELSSELITLQWEMSEREDKIRQVGEAMKQVELSISLDLRTIKDRGIKLVDAFS